MLAQPKPYRTVEEYLALERAAAYKSEYYKGEMFALAGASIQHNYITGNVFALLYTMLKEKPCSVFSSNLRVKVQEVGLYTYPDIVVCCGELVVEDSHGDTLLNPSLIVEVLSASTEAYDRGKKFEYYRLIPSLQEYVVAAQDRAHVEVFTRTDAGRWLLSEASGREGSIELASLGHTLALADVYNKVEFEDEAQGDDGQP